MATSLVWMWAQCGQTRPNAGGRRRICAAEKVAVTCEDGCVHPGQTAWTRKVGCTHNPEVAGSNPAPATSEVAGQRSRDSWSLAGAREDSWSTRLLPGFWREASRWRRLGGASRSDVVTSVVPASL